MLDSKKWLAVARIRKPHGVHGLMKLFSYSGGFEPLETVDEVRIATNSGVRTFSIEKKSYLGGDMVLKLEGIDNPEAVKAMAGSDVLMEREKIDPCSADEFFIADLVGSSLFFEKEDCGKVISVITNAPQDLLEIETPAGRKFLIPMLKQFVGQIDIENSRIELLDKWFVE